MKKILLSLTAAAALAAAAAPAAAQDWRGHHDRGYSHGGQNYTGYVDGLEWKIRNAADHGVISRGEARELLREFRSVQQIAWRVQTGAASGWERQRLDRTIARIESAVNRPSRYARGRYDRDDRYNGWRR